MLRKHIEKFGVSCFSEPFHPPFTKYFKENFGYDFTKTDDIATIENLLIKTMISDDQYPQEEFEKYEDFLDWLNKSFNKIIVLVRKDKRQQAESFAVNYLNGETWHIPKIYDLHKVDKQFIKNVEELFIRQETTILNFAEKYNHPVFYYEDLFLEHNIESAKKIFNHFNIEMDFNIYENYVDNKRRVRIDPPKVDKLF
jgi:hypothetical protein